MILRAASYTEIRLLLQDIPDKIMILGEGIQVVMTAALDADQRYFRRVELLQAFTVPDGDEEIPGAVDDIGMTAYFGQPEVGAEMIAQHIAHGQEGKESFYELREIIIG